MLQLTNLQDFPASARGGVLCIGNFDGVHRGHASMLGCGQALAREAGVPFVIMTFDPHPAVLLRPQTPRQPLMTTAQRLEALAATGPEVLIVVRVTPEMLQQSAADFLAHTVAGTLGATQVVEGASFTFGHAAAGTVDMLVAQGPRYGFGATIVPTVEQPLGDCTLIPVSSSMIRWLVARGRVRDAAGCLGRPYTLRGTVVRGAQRGRSIGFPTANLEVAQLLPAPGVYAGRARVGDRVRPAAISIGDNPTFTAGPVTAEAFLLDFQEDIYGATVDLEFGAWIREQYKYAGPEPLVRQMERDVALVRAWTA